MASTADFVWMDGEIVPWANAQIHVSAEAVLRGANVFEGMRAYWNSDERQLYIFRNEEHLRRLRQSAKIMRMSIPYTDEQFTQAFIDLIRKNRFTDNVHFRPVVYFDAGDYKWKPDEIRTGAFVLAFSRPPSAAGKAGIQSCVSSWRRNSDNSSPSRIKAAGNYHNSRLAYVDAKTKGFDTPIMLNDRGDVAEGPASCFMMVRDGVVITPPVNADILESITRDTLIQLYRDELGVQVVERDIDRSELYIADEAFFCGSGAEVVPIVGIDHYPMGDGKVGPLTKQIQEIYFRIATDKDGKYSKWLLPVYRDNDVR
ncbi:branched-chain amino acid transaminase [Paraburkholderia aspalathi]|uniref:branched-chain amino acid transaminase n=1 Tax=Paraburkholderia aspalathi TaxID=1324617 RepID=UPI001B01FD8D|nr:branched-chain amino acid transaminase [Paraburkholderia aspalathi]CAE6737831.1 Branched-chain-amino-acid aminotransferase [Paraburkholderia aspalathi]